MNPRQVQAIADEINEQLKKQLRRKPVRIEGYSGAEWVLLDYGDFIIHLFEKEARDFYDLERLWRDARRVEIPASVS
jgi:ribosome-associated protein